MIGPMTYVYHCTRCAKEIEFSHPMSETWVPTICTPCLEEMQRVPQGGSGFYVTGSRLKETPLRREFVVNNRDGSDTVYRTVEQAKRGELDRTGNRRTVEYNLRAMRSFGYLPQTEQSRQAEAIDQAPGGRMGSRVVT